MDKRARRLGVLAALVLAACGTAGPEDVQPDAGGPIVEARPDDLGVDAAPRRDHPDGAPFARDDLGVDATSKPDQPDGAALARDAGRDGSRPVPRLDAGPPLEEPPPCATPPCAIRPIIFLHGFTGNNDRWTTILEALVRDDPRYRSYTLSGNQEHATWTPRSIDRSGWLFGFDYYLAQQSDGAGSYSAGPGRIGSNRGHGCEAPAGEGFVVADRPQYDVGVEHEYASDLAAFVQSVLRATGASKVDVVGHSMGGMILRSYLMFHGGVDHVERALFLASPHRGVALAALLQLVGVGRPSWMGDHEVAEIDGGSLLSSTHFVLCGEDPATAGPFNVKILERELAAASSVQYDVMSGQLDPVVNYDSAHHPLARSHIVVPGVGHDGILDSAEAIYRVRDLLGGQTQ